MRPAATLGLTIRIVSSLAAAALLPTLLPAQQERWTIDQEGRRQIVGSNLCWLDDLDGDGVRDFAMVLLPAGGVYQPTTRAVRLCSGDDGATLREWSHATRANYGAVLANAGDLDGDGHDDLLIGAPQDATQVADAVIACSSASGAELFELRGVATGGDHFGASLAGLGDLDGDGVDDFAVGIPSFVGSGVKGRVDFYSGATRAVLGSVTGTSHETRFGDARRIASLGDLDGDGIGDLLTAETVKTLSSSKPNCNVEVWSGATRQSLLHATVLLSTWSATQSLCVAGAGDVDGDALPDLLISAPRTTGSSTSGRAHVVSGATGATLHTFLAPTSGELGTLCAGVGDVDLDGRADLAMTVLDATGDLVSIRSGRDGSELLRVVDDAPGQQSFAQSLAAGGDLDGDGVPELLLGSLPVPSGTRITGSVQVRSLADDATHFALEGIADDPEWRGGVAFVDDQDGDGLPELVTTESESEWDVVDVQRDLVMRAGGDGRELRREPDAGLMGRIVALPDVSGDGITDLAVSGVAWWAEFLIGYAPDPFLEVVEIRSGADLSLQRTFTSNASNVRFGQAVAMAAQPSGAVHVAIGAPDRAVYTLYDHAGRVDVHDAATGKRVFHVDGNSNFSDGEELGSAIAAAGDLNGDGVIDWVFGAPRYHQNWPTVADSGRVIFVSGVDGRELRTIESKADLDHFGSQVIALGDQDGDGIPELAVAAETWFNNFTGRVDFLLGKNGGIYKSIHGSTPNEYYGRSMAALPDCDGDGCGDLAIAVPGEPGVRSARVELRSGRDGALLRTIHAEGFAYDPAWLAAAPPAWLPSAAPRADGPWLVSIDAADALHGDRSGRFALHELDDLYLEIAPERAPAGATVAAAIRGGPSGLPAALLLESINGLPIGQFVAFGVLDAARELALDATVPPGLAGQTWQFRGYAIGWSGKLVDSQSEVLTLE